MSQTNRNEPCPCGSGKKYKKCCLGQQEPASQTSSAVSAELQQAMAGHEFTSLEEAQAFADKIIELRNQTPFDDFHGLSPEQMYHVLNFPFSAPHLVSFPEKLGCLPDAPILTLFALLVEAIGEKGLKPTAKGNLPRNLCREVAQRYWDKKTYDERNRYGQINKEEEFFDLHVTRVVAELAGLIRKYKGRFILSRECRKLLATEGLQVIYPRLLRTYVEQFNWSYRDAFAEAPFVQHAFLFTLYMLSRYGVEWHPSDFYEDNFLKAFPSALDEIEPMASYVEGFSPDWQARMCYTMRTIVDFAGFLGLAKVDKKDEEKPIGYGYMVKKLPLLDVAVCWSIPTR